MNIALILAGGTGTRTNGNKPKQFMEINGVPMLVHTVCRFKQHDNIDYVCVVVPEAYIQDTKELLLQYNQPADAVIAGGSDRRRSSYNGIKYLSDTFSQEDIVLIHDAARPNICEKIITDNITAARQVGGAVTAVTAQDTLLIGDADKNVAGYVNRENAYIVQTPQSFKLGLILEAHEQVNALISEGEIDPLSITDDSRLAVITDKKVAIVAGDKFNIKVTTVEDFGIICNIMK